MKKLPSSNSVVFLINDITALGGTERMCSMIANELCAAGFAITIISKHEGKNEPFFPLHASISRIQLYKNASSKHHFLLPFSIFKVINHLKPGLVISCDTQMCLYSSIPLRGKKHIAWEHFNSDICTKFGSRWFGRRLASKFCKKIVVLTTSDKTNWVNNLQADPNKVIVIPNPLPIKRIERWTETKRENIVLAVGRMTAQKGFDTLIKSWAKIDPESKHNWKLRIVGPAGSAKPELEQLIKEFKLEQSVELIPASLQIESEYQQASMYVMSSRYEGFGLTLIEAMGQGLPVIAFNCPMGPSEIIADKYGKLLPPDDIEEMATSIARFLTEPELRYEFGKLAHHRSEDYEPHKIIHHWTSMINQL